MQGSPHIFCASLPRSSHDVTPPPCRSSATSSKTFVVAEVMKQLSWMDDITGLGHWRTHDGAEVDLIIERRDGTVVAIEVKAATRVTTKDLTGLRTDPRRTRRRVRRRRRPQHRTPGLPRRRPHPGPAHRPTLDRALIHSGTQVLNGILQDQAQTLSRSGVISVPAGVHHLAGDPNPRPPDP
jgi:hypothetical protein